MMEMMKYIALHSALSETIQKWQFKDYTIPLFRTTAYQLFDRALYTGITPTTSLPKRMWHKQRFPKSSAKSRDSKDSPGTTQPSTNRDSIPKDLRMKNPSLLWFATIFCSTYVARLSKTQLRFFLRKKRGNEGALWLVINTVFLCLYSAPWNRIENGASSLVPAMQHGIVSINVSG